MWDPTGSYLRKYWTLPKENEEGYIKASDEVVGIVNLTNPESPVMLESRITPISEGQNWYRGTADENGWFLLTNPYSGKVLTENVMLDYYTTINGN